MALFNLFDGTPALGKGNDASPLTLGTEFYVTSPAWLTQIRHLTASEGSLARRTGAVFAAATGALVAGPFQMPVPVHGEWCALDLPDAVELTPGVHYRVAIFHPEGDYPATGYYFDDEAARYSGPVVVPNVFDAVAGAQGSYKYDAYLAFPDNSFNATAYFSDVTISDVDPSYVPPVLSGDVDLVLGRPDGHSLAPDAPDGHPLAPASPVGHPLTAIGGDRLHLPASGREYARFPVNVPASTALEASFDGVTWAAMERPNDSTARILVAGPAATGNPLGTPVLTLGHNAALVRLTSNPEVVIRSAGSIYVYTP
ncbi:hypothetical protein SEA_WILDWEST_1 [Arthrobacter phage Wildwest]|uniref:DUF4082 domain-containing protein n=1 Tax=Arthrobacter phage Wildwest TaxID=3051767 RepID=A0AA96HTM1_9CAUD|nr:hypothetical protein SEA_WILDWEST_1 [Arthrobacter phage Wildwest]